MQQGHREEHREQGLCLQDERGQPGRHPPVDADEQEAELADAEERPDDQHPAEPDLRAGDQEHRGERHEGEPQGDEQQRGEVVEPGVDHHEVDAPDGRDEDG